LISSPFKRKLAAEATLVASAFFFFRRIGRLMVVKQKGSAW
jgi:hypothetical protein